MRVGMGHDVHRLVSGRKLILGGVDIPYEKGLLGHSDADVLTHAVCDALLGAAGLGDIGIHFPDTDNAFKNISSLTLLKRTFDMVRENGFAISNMDVTVTAQAPKLSPHREQMTKNIAETLGIGEDSINIKFTTSEGLGYIGRKEGIKADCIVLLSERQKEK